MSWRIASAVALAVTATTGLLAACSSGDKNGFTQSDAGGDAPGLVGIIDAEAGPKLGCTSDLKSTLRDGKIDTKCADDQGCAGGTCIPACEAAALNKSSVGCEYMAISPPYYQGPDSTTPAKTACFVAFVANTWGSDVTLTVDRGGENLVPDKFTVLPEGSGANVTYKPIKFGVVPAGKVAMVFLSNESSAACPGGVTPAKSNSARSGTGKGNAFRIRTSAPVVAYDIFPYGGGVTAVTSATLLIPSTAWGINYIAASAAADSGQPWIVVAAREDNTTVTVRPKVGIVGGGGVAFAAANSVASYTLNAGEYIKFDQRADLSGSPIESDKPIGSWAGNTCANVPADKAACDSLHQQMPPVQSWGSRYVGAHYRDRYWPMLESPPFRVIGAVDGTRLTYVPVVPGAPTTLNAGQILDFRAQDAFVIQSQDAKHPFYLGSYMTGCADANPDTDPYFSDCRGDPEFTNVIPDAQYLKSYTFFTDPTYPETNLVFVRRKGSDGKFHDVTLDCVGTLSGWVPVPGTDFEFYWQDLVRGNFDKQGTCDNGLHTASSDEAFGLTVWGWGSSLSKPFATDAVSYAYPAGASVLPINGVVVAVVPK